MIPCAQVWLCIFRFPASHSYYRSPLFPPRPSLILSHATKLAETKAEAETRVAGALAERDAALARTLEAQARWEQREPRPEDVERIRQLTAELAETQRRQRKAVDDAKYLRMELINREENFSRTFGSGGGMRSSGGGLPPAVKSALAAGGGGDVAAMTTPQLMATSTSAALGLLTAHAAGVGSSLPNSMGASLDRADAGAASPLIPAAAGAGAGAASSGYLVAASSPIIGGGGSGLLHRGAPAGSSVAAAAGAGARRGSSGAALAAGGGGGAGAGGAGAGAPSHLAHSYSGFAIGAPDVLVAAPGQMPFALTKPKPAKR